MSSSWGPGTWMLPGTPAPLPRLEDGHQLNHAMAIPHIPCFEHGPYMRMHGVIMFFTWFQTMSVSSEDVLL
jgi:hypothetical protein